MLLSIERSSSPGSVALFSDNGNLICSVSETAESRHGGDSFCPVKTLLDEFGADINAIRRFAVGIGPGSFSGIRSAIALLEGLALPIGVGIEGVNSAHAAAQAFRKTAPEYSCGATVAVVGDARRGHIWVVVYGPDDGAKEVELVNLADLTEKIPEDAAIITPDWDRLGDFLSERFSSARIHNSNPTAVAVGELAFAGFTVPAVPLYMHRAVEPAV